MAIYFETCLTRHQSMANPTEDVTRADLTPVDSMPGYHTFADPTGEEWVVERLRNAVGDEHWSFRECGVYFPPVPGARYDHKRLALDALVAFLAGRWWCDGEWVAA